MTFALLRFLGWIKAALKRLPVLFQTLEPAQADDVLELDELWSFVLKKSNKRWIWIALCRSTRQIVAYYVGDRSKKSCRQLWQRIPDSYKACTTSSDFWEAYQKVFPVESHHSVGKETVRRLMLSVGTTPCLNVWLVSSVRLYLSPSRRRFTI